MKTRDELDAMSIRGAYRPDGTFVGFDYARQAWIDTCPTTERDLGFPAGTANNPLATLPT